MCFFHIKQITLHLVRSKAQNEAKQNRKMADEEARKKAVTQVAIEVVTATVVMITVAGKGSRMPDICTVSTN